MVVDLTRKEREIVAWALTIAPHWQIAKKMEADPTETLQAMGGIWGRLAEPVDPSPDRPPARPAPESEEV